jgi:hypothetical protein
MGVQVCLIATNCSESIYKTLKTWNFVDRIFVYLNNCTDNTRDILKNIENVEIYEGYFDSFSNTRNRCLELCRDKKYEWTIMIDDSYEYRGSGLIEELKNIKGDYAAIEIHRDTMVYKSIRVLRNKKGNVQFTGKIHECIVVPIYQTLKNSFIEDIEYPEHAKRTRKRQIKDLEILRGDVKNARNLYYIACTLYNFYIDADCTYEEVAAAFEERINFKTTDDEETFQTYMIYNKFVKDRNKLMRNYYEAIILFPSRAGEAYYELYMITNINFFLEKAYSLRHLGPYRLICNKELYGDDGIIKKLYVNKKNICQ